MKKTLALIFILAALLLSVYLAGKKTNLFKFASEETPYMAANLVMDVTSTFPFQRNWKYLAQGGESPKESLSEVVSQVRNLKPQYIRIDHVFDFYSPVLKDDSGKLSFDWSRFDKEMLAIRSIGAKPFVSLSYMPPSISSGTEVDVPQKWEDWQTSVRELINHVSGKSGLGVRDVYYEVWNEPDLFGKFTVNGEKSYMDLYRYASRGAQETKNTYDFYFGGPATTVPFENWTRTLVGTAEKENLRLDFLSWHRYSDDIRVFESDIKNVSSWISGYSNYSKLPLIISESGINSEIDPAYDTEVSAIHTLALHASTIGYSVKIFGFEIKDGLGPSKHWGRWGILTHENFGSPEPKPRYLAYEFLDQMIGERIVVSGEGSNVRSFATLDRKNKTLRIMIVNYNRSSDRSENVPVTVSGFEKVPEDISITKFIGDKTEFTGSYANGVWTGVVAMKPNTAVILELSAF